MENYTWYFCAKFCVMCKCGVSLINYHLLRHFLQNEDVFQCPSIYQSLFAISMRREIKHDKFVAQKCSLVEQENSKMNIHSSSYLFIFYSQEQAHLDVWHCVWKRMRSHFMHSKFCQSTISSTKSKLSMWKMRKTFCWKLVIPSLYRCT